MTIKKNVFREEIKNLQCFIDHSHTDACSIFLYFLKEIGSSLQMENQLKSGYRQKKDWEGNEV